MPCPPAQEDHHAGEAVRSWSRALQIVADADRLTSRAGTALLVGLDRSCRPDEVVLAGDGRPAAAPLAPRSRADAARPCGDGRRRRRLSGGPARAARPADPVRRGSPPMRPLGGRCASARPRARLTAVRRGAGDGAGARLGAGRGARAGDARPRRDTRERALRQGAGRRELQARLRFPSAALLRGDDRGGARRHLAPGQRGANTAATISSCSTCARAAA